MPALTQTTKLSKINGAFAELAAEYMKDGNAEAAEATVRAFGRLPDQSKVRLFDILAAVYKVA